MKTKNIEEKTYHCPNCGGEVIHSYNHKCCYCGGLIDFNEPEEQTIQVKPEDLVHIQLREIFREPIMNNVIIVLDGYKCPMPKVYEYDGKENYVSKVEEYVNPPKCGICIEMPIYKIKKYGMSYVRHRILTSGIRYNELDNVMQQILDNKEIRFFARN